MIEIQIYLPYLENRKAINRTEKLKDKTPIFVAKTRIYDIFVAKIYDYAPIDNFWGFPRFIDSPTSYATLGETKETTNHIIQKQIFVHHV